MWHAVKNEVNLDTGVAQIARIASSFRFVRDPLAWFGAMRAAPRQDRGYVYFYYAATVRVEEESNERLLTSLSWFLDGLPDVQARWREGSLVGPGRPETD